MEDFREYTLIEALAETYEFNPRKKTNGQIVFELTDKDEPGRWLRFGKNWSKLDHVWHFLTWEKNCPCLTSEEKHFVSNLMTYEFAKRQMRYSAQQGTFRCRKIFDSRIDNNWHNNKED